MKTYSDYKKCKIKWCPTIPSSWDVVPLKRIFSNIGSGATPKSNNNNYYGGNVSWIQSGDLHNHFLSSTKKRITDSALRDVSALKIYKTPFISIAMYGASIGNLSISKIDSCTNQACCNMSGSAGNIEYFYYLLSSCKDYMISLSAGGTQPNISQLIIKNLILPLPSVNEQDQIVRFLDWKVSEINKLINVKEKEIVQIQELKKTVINDAVTHGLNRNVPMKYSGVEWLGDIPEHWKIIKLRKILHPFSEKNHPELPLLSVVREKGVIVRDVDDKESNHNFIPDDLSGYKMVKKGQFAMNKMKAWQGSYGVSDYTGIVSPAYFIFDVDFENLEYFHYAIRSKVYVNFFAQASDGIRVGQWDLSMNKMKEIPFIVPPEEEQKEIVNYIPKALERYTNAINTLESQIEALHELKNKLISDAVTGKIDVRNAEIPEYEFTDESADSDLEDADFDVDEEQEE
ncbi:restriction endonuclease subunit S [Erysipelotrichaceae bacterium AF15-26LB]|nr:type I restriction modification DNA specificity domain protein [Erysipelotrichaceae bacterium 3_1_53]MCR0349546.1 restriction endonuclease subunit S [[Clostridium] innocuum]RJV86506.1 restriction endonuclease subunit S [Erysipelotrichaceae bacterium AF15-26LB]RJV89656.1 restriction endonuclease subunit S [Erysipelotrichaceae bacterium AF19-24AC]